MLGSTFLLDYCSFSCVGALLNRLPGSENNWVYFFPSQFLLEQAAGFPHASSPTLDRGPRLLWILGRIRHAVREEGERLSRLVATLRDMQHLDEDNTRLLSEAIADLEERMRGIGRG